MKVAITARMIRMIVMIKKLQQLPGRAMEVPGGASTDNTIVQYMQSSKSR